LLVVSGNPQSEIRNPKSNREDSMSEAYIIDACRTPRGRRKGSLSEVHPIDVFGVPLNAIVQRSGIDPKDVDDVVVGFVSETG